MKKKKKKHCFVSRFSFAFQGFGLWIKEYKKKNKLNIPGMITERSTFLMVSISSLEKELIQGQLPESIGVLLFG